MVYLDNAATTPMHPEVIKLMTDQMQQCFANPSSVHSLGRKSKTLVEIARKNIAELLGVSANELIFTSGGSEANNLILWNAITQLGVKNIITSRVEHSSVLKTINYLANQFNVDVHYVKLDQFAQVDYNCLSLLLDSLKGKMLISLMHVNNEIGTILDFKTVSQLAQNRSALFHSDTVQSLGYFDLNLSDNPVDFITASAHKFHGPKGVGFVYIKKGLLLQPTILGGNQEQGIRAGTENIHGIIGLEKAFNLVKSCQTEHLNHVKNIKQYCVEQLKLLDDNIVFNANSDANTHAPHILNVRLPINDSMLLFKLDMAGVACSGGSACQSGAQEESHVLSEILTVQELQSTSSIRVSFSQYTTQKDVDKTVEALRDILS